MVEPLDGTPAQSQLSGEGQAAALRSLSRVAVAGTTGSGKTTLARRLALTLGVPHVELDALHWEAGWTPATPEVFRARVTQVTSGERWVCEGNYSAARDIVWGRATLVLWLDYPLWLVLFRLVPRTLVRVVKREVLWQGNRESWRTLLGRNSLIAWALSSHGRHRREYPERLREYGHLPVVRVRSPRELDRWVECILSDSLSRRGGM